MFYENEHKLTVYSHGTNGNNIGAMIDYLVVDKSNRILMASLISTPSRIEAIEEGLQESRTCTIRPYDNTSGSSKGCLMTTLSTLPNKKSYNIERVPLDDFVQIVAISKQVNPNSDVLKEHQDNIKSAKQAGNKLPVKPIQAQDLVISFDGNLDKEIFSALTRNYATPMLKEWAPYVCKKLAEADLYEELVVNSFVNETPLRAALIKANEEDLEQIISNGIASMEIIFANYEFSDNEEDRLSGVQTTSDYIRLFPGELANAIQDNLEVRFDATNDLHANAFKELNMCANENGITGYYPPQANAIMGAVNTLSKEKFSFIIGEMGCGKSAIGTGIPFVANSVDVKDGSKVTPFRAFVLSPNIMVDKWAREVRQRIPGVIVKVIRSMDDVYKLYNETSYINEKGKRKFNGPKQIEYYIMSTELLKATIPQQPEVNQRYSKDEAMDYLRKRVTETTFDDKGRRHLKLAPVSAVEGEPKYIKLETTYLASGQPGQPARKIAEIAEPGVYCPHCGKPIKVKENIQQDKFFRKFNKKKEEFTYSQKSENTFCKADVYTKNVPKEEVPASKWVYDETLEKKVRMKGLQICNHNFWGPQVGLTKGKRKVSPAWFINKKFPRGFFKYLIADEVHELASGKSSRSQGFGQMVNHTEKQILLTGTLFGGMASDIFYLLARLAPDKLTKESMDFKSEATFNKKYGVVERLSVETETSTKTSVKSKPGINPHLFPLYLMENAVFLELSDLADALPGYEEVPVVVEMDIEHEQAYDQFANAFIERCQRIDSLKGSQSMTSLINLLYQYADAPYNFKQVKLYDEAGKLHDIYTPKAFEPDYEPAKLRKLKQQLHDEVAQGRKNLVYVKYTGEDSRTRMDTWMYDQLKEEGFNVGILRNGSAYDGIKMPKSSTEREKWLKDMMEENNWDVLITNPRLVKVGLDLLDFPNIHFYQLDYSTFEYMQASRRSWRIGQMQDVKVFTYVNAGTIQEDVLRHLARKIDASLAIQGKFSEEGLRAMSESTGGITDIAKELINGNALEQVETVYDIFKRKNQTFEDMKTKEFEDYPNYTMNPIEGGIQRVREIAKELRENLFTVADTVAKSKPSKKRKEYREAVQESLDNYFDKIEELLSTVDVSDANKGIPKKKRVSEGQLELDIFALV